MVLHNELHCRYRLMLNPWPIGPLGNRTTFSGLRTCWDWLWLEKQLDDDDGDNLLTNCLFSVGGDSSAAADPKILSLASAYSFSRCSNVFSCGFEFCCEVEDKAGDESGRFRMVTTGFGRWRILGRKSSPPFDKIVIPFCFAAAISCSFLILSCFCCSNCFSSWKLILN